MRLSRTVARVITMLMLVVGMAAAQAPLAFTDPEMFSGLDWGLAAIALMDLDADGRLDGYCPNVIGPGSYLISNPNGSFRPAIALPPTGSQAVLVPADLDGDSLPDLVSVDFTGLAPAIVGFLNGGAGCAGAGGLALTPFSIPLPPTSGSQSATSLDSYLHAFDWSTRTIHTIIVGGSQATAATPLLVPYSTYFPAGAGGVRSLVECDLNGDGLGEFVVAYTATFSLYPMPVTLEFAINSGTGMASNALVPTISTSGNFESLVCGDFNGDGLDDVVVADTTGVHLHTSQISTAGGVPGVTFSSTVILPSIFGSLHTSDIDGDGDLDILVSSPGAIRFLINNSGTFVLDTYSIASPRGGISTGDLDNDGDLDISLASPFQPRRLFTNLSVPPERVRPGTLDGVILETSVLPIGALPVFTGGPLRDIKRGRLFSQIGARVSAPAFTSPPVYLCAEFFATGCPPQGGAPSLYISGFPQAVILPPCPCPLSGSLTVSYPVMMTPPAMLSLLIQAILVSPLAANGVFAASDAHEIQF